MPIYELRCPRCGHTFKGLVLAGTREPEEWACSVCGARDAVRVNAGEEEEHPLETNHGSGCPCCGG